MDKDLLNFINGITNYYRGEMSIGREPCGGGKDYFVLKSGDIVIVTFWSDVGRAPPKVEETKSEPGDDPPKKRTMGGKAPYVMLMTARMSEMVREGKATAEQIGNLAMLSPHIEWGTGKLIKKRSKKPLKAEDIQKLLGMSRNTWARKSKEMKDSGLITVTQDGYFVSTDLFKKGGAKKREE